MDAFNRLYYYIDEAGTLNHPSSDKDRYFIISCCITDTPELLEYSLNKLKQGVLNDPYSAYDIKEFEKQGFHACDNHFDIRAKYYTLLLTLNVRIFSVVIDKTSDIYNELISRHKNLLGVYYELLHVLLEKRITHNRNCKNILIFEEYGSKPSMHLNNINDVLSRVVATIKRDFIVSDVDISVEVHSKDDILLSVIDYANYVLFQMLQPKTDERMVLNFKLIEPKMALLHSIHNKSFYSEKNRINFEEIKGRGDM